MYYSNKEETNLRLYWIVTVSSILSKSYKTMAQIGRALISTMRIHSAQIVNKQLWNRVVERRAKNQRNGTAVDTSLGHSAGLKQQRVRRVMIKILFTNATNVGILGTSDVSERNER